MKHKVLLGILTVLLAALLLPVSAVQADEPSLDYAVYSTGNTLLNGSAQYALDLRVRGELQGAYASINLIIDTSIFELTYYNSSSGRWELAQTQEGFNDQAMIGLEMDQTYTLGQKDPGNTFVTLVEPTLYLLQITAPRLDGTYSVDTTVLSFCLSQIGEVSAEDLRSAVRPVTEEEMGTYGLTYASKIIQIPSAETPVITAQPLSAVYTAESAVAVPLTVDASVEAGVLSWQWYVSTTGSFADAVPIDGAVSSSYTPDVSEDGTKYYFAQVTCTDENLLVNKTASAVSEAAVITTAYSTKAVITSGTYSADVNRYCADGYYAANNGSGTWTVTEKFWIYGSNMILGNDLSMQFFIPKASLQGEDYYVVITKTDADGQTRSETTWFGSFYDRSEDLWQVNYRNIAAREMADAFAVVVWAGNDTVDTSDDYAVSHVHTDSVRNYALNLLRAYGGNTSLVAVVVDMLNYGAAAQAYFQYNTDDPANSSKVEEEAALLAQYSSYATDSYTCTDQYSASGTFCGSSLSLKTNIVLNLYFYNVTEGMYATVMYTHENGTAVTKTIQYDDFHRNGTLFGVIVDDLVIKDGYRPVECILYNTDGTIAGSVQSSIDSISYYGLQSSETQNIYDTLMKFVTSARTYFGEG